MENRKFSRLMICGTGSGCGKTTVMAALLHAFRQKEVRLASFKCGPDYIDPMFHRWITGSPSINLDGIFLDAKEIRSLVGWQMEGKSLGLMEGVMGYYDGQGSSDRGSSYHIGEITKTPAVLVVRPKGTALSAAAMIQGYQNFRKPSGISGILLNGVREGMYPFFRDMIERETGLKVYGFLPERSDLAFESRHLGLVTAAEQERLTDKIQELGELAARYIDLEGLMALAASADPLEYEPPFREFRPEKKVRVGVAMDQAFCFYYEENLECLRRLGAEIVPFSPLKDRAIPEGIHGIYLGGGYPEIYGEALSRNLSMRASIRRAVSDGLPVIGECGGYMYLCEEMTDHKGRSWPMAGAVKGRCRMGEKLGPFGYVRLSSDKETLLGPGSFSAHEFHYSVMEDGDSDYWIQKNTGKNWCGGTGAERIYAAYPHLYFYGNKEIPVRFVRTMEAVRNDR